MGRNLRKLGTLFYTCIYMYITINFFWWEVSKPLNFSSWLILATPLALVCTGSSGRKAAHKSNPQVASLLKLSNIRCKTIQFLASISTTNTFYQILMATFPTTPFNATSHLRCSWKASPANLTPAMKGGMAVTTRTATARGEKPRSNAWSRWSHKLWYFTVFFFYCGRFWWDILWYMIAIYGDAEFCHFPSFFEDSGSKNRVNTPNIAPRDSIAQ